jgi:hypothetical protein
VLTRRSSSIGPAAGDNRGTPTLLPGPPRLSA